MISINGAEKSMSLEIEGLDEDELWLRCRIGYKEDGEWTFYRDPSLERQELFYIIDCLDEVLDGNVKKYSIDTLDSVITMEVVRDKNLYYLTMFFEVWAGNDSREISATEVMNKDRYIEIIEEFENLAFKWNPEKDKQ